MAACRGQEGVCPGERRGGPIISREMLANLEANLDAQNTIFSEDFAPSLSALNLSWPVALLCSAPKQGDESVSFLILTHEPNQMDQVGVEEVFHEHLPAKTDL